MTAPEYQSATLVGSWAGLPRAFPSGWSSFPALDHSKGRRCSDALSNGRGRLLAPHQSNRLANDLPRRLSRMRVCLVPPGQTRAFSLRFDGWRRRSAHFAGELRSQKIAHRYRVHLSRLSSSLSSRWIDPNENGLTHAQADFAFGATSSD